MAAGRRSERTVRFSSAIHKGWRSNDDENPWREHNTVRRVSPPSASMPVWRAPPGGLRGGSLRPRLPRRLAPASRQPEVPVALLPDEAREALASPAGEASIPSRVVRLSTDTMLKQRANHSDLGAADYRRLPDLVERGVTIGRRRRSLSFFGAFNGRWYRAVVKRTEKDELYLVTYHRVDPGRLRGELRRGRLIRKAR